MPNHPKVSEFSADDLDKYANSLYAFAKKRVQSDDDIFDLIQDTFLDFFDQKDRFREHSSALTYLTSILRNKIFHLYRKQNREISVTSEDMNLMLHGKMDRATQGRTSGNSPIEIQIDSNETQRIVDACLKRLKSPYFEAFVMREIEELPTDEICNILEVSVTNLNVILHRARQKLQQMLREEGIDHAH
ncbi:MAG: RNA polymerase sigma factor [Spirochaetota bacterium]